MAETLLSFGVQKLWDLLVRASDRFQEVDEQLTDLKSDLNLLRSFLKDADAKKHGSALVKNSVEEIKELVFDGEDIIETFLLKEERRKTSGIKKRMRQLSCVIVDKRELASDIGGISKRISKVIRDMQSFGIQQLIGDGSEYSHPLLERQKELRKTFPTSYDNDLVGLEEKVEKLVGCLVEENNIQVVSITGMGGIGKTTLARQVFNHEMINTHFTRVVWVCVSQQFTRMYVWQTILRTLRPECQVLKMTEDELQENLVRVLKTEKALIVLDDIWREEDWERINPIFPQEKGWKVLLTSRNEDVALRADSRCFSFKPDFLTLEESWTLFQRIVCTKENTTESKVREKMEDMGMQMIKRCGGLPLAVKVLAGLLAAQYTLREWKRISETIGSHLVGGTSFNDKNISSVYHVLYLSYEELPAYLKQCFLYLSHFPEDYEIYMEQLSYYWAAEGISRPRYYNGASIRDVADGYVEELVKRHMVISERDHGTSRFETCQLHDMMREVCLLKAEEENFVQIVDASTVTSCANSKPPCQSRRVAVHTNNEKGYIQNPSLRSLMFIERLQEPYQIASCLGLRRMQLLRVLDLTRARLKGSKLPSSIGELIHLKYLSLCGARVSNLPSSMRNLRSLLYLNLRVNKFDIIHVPDVFKEMRELRYLCLPFGIHDKTKLALSNLVNLETLENFQIKASSVKDLHGMTRLQTLSILYNGDSCPMETLSSHVGKMRNLEYLTITDHFTGQREFVLDCIHLNKLNLTLYMPKFPDEQRFPSHLTSIILSRCCLEEDPMPILEKLLHLNEVSLGTQAFAGKKMVCSRGGFPKLQNLIVHHLELEEWRVKEGSMPCLHTLCIWQCEKLKELPQGVEKLSGLRVLELGEDTFLGRRIVCTSGGFPRLQKLRLLGLSQLEEWIVEEGSMPLLDTLDIRECEMLKELPDGLRFITSLKELILDTSKDEFKEKLSEGGEDHYKVQHISLVYIMLNFSDMIASHR